MGPSLRANTNRETKGRFHKKGGFGECSLVPVFVPGEHANIPSFRFSFQGTSAKITLLENHPFQVLSTSEICEEKRFVRLWAVSSPISEDFFWVLALREVPKISEDKKSPLIN